VIAKINDPLRAAAYAELGVATVCRTGLIVDALNAHLGLPASGLPGMLAPSGQHGGDGHRHEDAHGAAGEASSPTVGATSTAAGQPIVYREA
jgi:hypothetical protein